jgi:hypothetical protein
MTAPRGVSSWCDRLCAALDTTVTRAYRGTVSAAYKEGSMACGTRTRRVGRLLVFVALATAALAFGAVPAGAQIVERERFVNTWGPETYEDCGFEIEVEGRETGHARIRKGKGKTASAFFAHVRFSYRETHTNTETGEWFVVRGHGVFNEVKATRVSGTVFRFVAIEAGQPFVIEDSTGRVVLRDRGVIRYSILFDTLGDDEPGGELIEEFEPEVRGPHPAFNEEADFCAIATRLIGP